MGDMWAVGQQGCDIHWQEMVSLGCMWKTGSDMGRGRGTVLRWPQGESIGGQQEPDDTNPQQPLALSSSPHRTIKGALDKGQ